MIRCGSGLLLKMKLQVVVDGLHPGPQLLLLGAGQKAQVVAQRDDGPRDEKARVGFLLHDLLEAHGDGEQRLARSRPAHEGRHADLVVEQQLQGEALLLVSRLDALVRALPVDERPQLPPEVPGQRRLGGRDVVLQHEELVGPPGPRPFISRRPSLKKASISSAVTSTTPAPV